MQDSVLSETIHTIIGIVNIFNILLQIWQSHKFHLVCYGHHLYEVYLAEWRWRSGRVFELLKDQAAMTAAGTQRITCLVFLLLFWLLYSFSSGGICRTVAFLPSPAFPFMSSLHRQALILSKCVS